MGIYHDWPLWAKLYEACLQRRTGSKKKESYQRCMSDTPARVSILGRDESNV